MLLWMYGIAGSVCILVLSAGVVTQMPEMAGVHLFIASLVPTVMALLAVSETRKLIKSGDSQIMIVSSLMRYMGLIWAWGALAINITYGTGILDWAAWWQYFIAFVLASGLCLFLSRVLFEGVGDEIPDENLLRVSKYIAATTLFFMVAAIIAYGMDSLIGGSIPGAWAANHVILFGALALAAVAAYQLKAGVNKAR